MTDVFCHKSITLLWHPPLAPAPHLQIHHEVRHPTFLCLQHRPPLRENTQQLFPVHERVCSKQSNLILATSLRPNQLPCHTHTHISRIKSVTCPATPSLVTLQDPFLAFVSRFVPPLLEERIQNMISEHCLSRHFALVHRDSALHHAKFSYNLDFPHTGEIQRPNRPWCTKKNQFLLCQMFEDHLAHMNDQWYADSREIHQTDNSRQEDEQ